MDHRPKCQCYNYKSLSRKHRMNLHDLGVSRDFLDMLPKAHDKRKN